ncbi:hypothetical protein BGZ81_009412 [Podila clonocystis]|nr:hypothetical protein BGZ81_009412 [Podila clonocystis]
MMLTHSAMWLLLLLLLAVSSVQGALVANAPSASDLDGVHILIDNDVDTSTNDTSMILLSKKRNYQDSMKACESLGESGYLANSTAASNLALAKLLKMTPVAEAEVRSSGRYWIKNENAPTNRMDCSSIDRNGVVSKTWCSYLHPTICSNSAPRRRVSRTNPEGDTSRQIKVPTNNLGTLQGHRDSTAFRFYGIPYAEPPVGANRFAAPKPLKNQDNGTTVDANKFGHACTQLSSMNFTFDDEMLGAQQSEDCLYLNVFTPTLKSKSDKGIPVMVYVHGGGFTVLSGTSPVFEPGNLVSRGGVVVVTLNYRLNIFGLFENQPAISKSSAPGNLPTRDQIAALHPFSGPDFAAEIGNRTLQNLGCGSANLTCAQNKTTEQVRDAQVKAMDDVRKLPGNQWILGAAVYRPCVDGNLIPANFDKLVQQGKHNVRANILWGWTKDEYAAFLTSIFPDPVPVNANKTQTYIALDGDTARYEKTMTSPYYQYNSTVNDTVRDQLGRAFTDLYWTCPYQALSRGAAQRGRVYTYQFNHGRSFFDAIGMSNTSYCTGKICHGDDIVPMFGSGDIFPNVTQTGDDARFSRQIIDRVATFARTGDPNPRKGSKIGAAASNTDVTGSPWRAYISGSNDVMELNLNSTMSKNADKVRCDWMEQNVKYDYELYGPGKKTPPVTSTLIGTPSAVPSGQPRS